MRPKPALLIITYMRFEQVVEILNIAIANGIERIYISVDGRVDTNNPTYKEEFCQILKAACNNEEVSLKVRFSNLNLGCSASVLSGCDWVFSEEEFVAVLEDDCIPSSEFFKFLIEGYPILQTENPIWMLCGTQFVPEEITRSEWFLSRYALIWGWATTRDKWHEIGSAIRGTMRIQLNSKVGLNEIAFWNSGARRASEGWVDAWDTVVVQRMIIHNKYSVLPGTNLVRNIGYDHFATHTKEDSAWMNTKTGDFISSEMKPAQLESADEWLKNNFYKINFSHPVRFFLSILRDRVFGGKPSTSSLSLRWNIAKKEKFELFQITNR